MDIHFVSPVEEICTFPGNNRLYAYFDNIGYREISIDWFSEYVADKESELSTLKGILEKIKKVS